MAISVKDNTIEFNSQIYTIESWIVWYMTPMGLFENWEQAIERVVDNGMDPNFTVIPVPVALARDNVYEVFVRV